MFLWSTEVNNDFCRIIQTEYCAYTNFSAALYLDTEMRGQPPCKYRLAQHTYPLMFSDMSFRTCAIGAGSLSKQSVFVASDICAANLQNIPEGENYLSEVFKLNV